MIAAAAVGFVVAPSSGGGSRAEGLTQKASASPLGVSYPASWSRRSAPKAPAVALSSELALGPSATPGSVLVLGLSKPVDPTLLPASLKSALPSGASSQVVNLPQAQFLRYEGISGTGTSGSGTAYAVPTTQGAVVAVCLPGSQGTGFIGRCEQVLSSLRLSSGSFRSLGPDPTYAHGLSSAIAMLNSVVSGAAQKLQAATKPLAQATAAKQLADAYTKAAKQVATLKPGPATAAHEQLLSALRALGRAYGELAGAAQHNDAKTYAAARESINTASSALPTAFAALKAAGYGSS